MDYEIFYPTPISEVDPIDDNIDVCIKLGGKIYTMVVATPKNLETLMKNDGNGFLMPCAPFAVVEKITEENIQKLVKAFLEDDPAYLKIYGGDIL